MTKKTLSVTVNRLVTGVKQWLLAADCGAYADVSVILLSADFAA